MQISEATPGDREPTQEFYRSFNWPDLLR